MKEASKKKRTNDTKSSIKNFDFDGTKVVQPQAVNVNTTPKAVIYCRVSWDRQVKDWFGIETQEKLCRERCNKQVPPIEVVKVFRNEAVSWNNNDRKWFNDLVDYLKQENGKYVKITHFVCRELSRVSRPDLDAIGDAFELEWKIKQYGVKVCDINGSIDDSTSEWKFMKVITYAVAWYERNRINKMTQNGRRGRLMMGHRAFPTLPMWYKRIYEWKNYTDLIDTIKWPMIKQWLELYANDPTLTPWQLYHYLNDKWLTTERISKKADNKVYRTYVDKMFQIHRLYFYAWYIIYPSRDINELVEWKHEWLISLATANKIKDKLQLTTKWIKTIREDDPFVLRWLIQCTWCKRSFTWRPTSKVTKTGEKKYYNYYGCQCDGCSERVTTPKDPLEQQVIDMIKDIELPEEMQTLFESIFNQARSNSQQNRKGELAGKEKRMKDLQGKMESIKKMLPKLDLVTQDALFKSYSEDYTKYFEEAEYLKELLEVKDDSEREKRIIFAKTKELIKSPLSFWELGDNGLRKLLLKVRFGDTLQYSKEWWLQTSQTPSLYSVLCDLKSKITGLWVCRESNPGPVA